jgi:hypothetical protein
MSEGQLTTNGLAIYGGIRVNPIRLTAFALGLGSCMLAVPTVAAEQTYTYTVLHPVFGDIGNFTDRIDRSGGQLRIYTHMDVAVRLLGVLAYREEAQGSEVMQGNQLVSIENVGDVDGQPLSVHGQISGGKFVVKSRAGTITAPLNVVPSDPWLVRLSTQGKVVSTRTGQVVDVTVTGGEPATVEVQGAPLRTHHYIVNGDKRQEVWMDDSGIPVKFRSLEDGVAIDFVLKTPLAQAIPGYVATASRVVPEARAGASDR